MEWTSRGQEALHATRLEVGLAIVAVLTVIGVAVGAYNANVKRPQRSGPPTPGPGVEFDRTQGYRARRVRV